MTKGCINPRNNRGMLVISAPQLRLEKKCYSIFSLELSKRVTHLDLITYGYLQLVCVT